MYTLGVRRVVVAAPNVRFLHVLRAAPLAGSFKDKFVWESDLNKRPSELEILKKKLPSNTPTLGERIRRDREYEFHEYDPKSGYYKGKTGTWRDYAEGLTTKDMVKISLTQLKVELGKWKDEMLDDRLAVMPREGDSRVEWTFDGDHCLDEWVTTCDSDWGEGYSTCALARSGSGKSVFSGELSTRVPQDGRLHKSGYCNVASIKKRASFGRLKDLEWCLFSDLVLRVRGDGRQYRINIQVATDFDVRWNDLWSYPLYTRGGPYWQYVRIPFSKFYLGFKGKIQDKQEKVPLEDVTGISITLADDVDGPFALELDYVGVKLKPFQLQEKFRYEDYVYPRKNFTTM